MLKHLNLAAKCLWRDWRAGEWIVVFFALLLAVTAITSIHFFTDRLVRGLERQGARFLGGNLVITSPTAIPVEWVKRAEDLEIKTAAVWSYPSVIGNGKHLQLVNLQAVSDNYPLLGDKPLHPDTFNVWVEPRLLPLLTAVMGDTVTIGAKAFQIQRILTPDIDMLNTGWTIAPRLLMRLADVPATRTVLPGSRVEYRLLLVGNPAALQAFRLWITPKLKPSQTLLDVHNQRFALLSLLDRTHNYLQLVLLACVLMSGVAIALSIQQYLRRHYAQVALWRCLGAQQDQITRLVLYQLLLLALMAGVMGISLGYLMENLFARLFESYLLFSLPSASLAPVITGFTTSVLLLLAFASPVIYVLPRTSPLYLWREDRHNPALQGKFAITVSILCTAGLIGWLMGYSLLTLYFAGLLGASLLLLAIIGRLLLQLLRLSLAYTQGPLRRGLSQLIQHANSVTLQFIGFTLIIVALVTVGLVRSHLMTSWQQTVSTHAPNYFAINIAPTDLTPLNHFFQEHNIPIDGIYPMARGRLTALNSQPILSAVPPDAVNHNALHRELNLSSMLILPSDNKIVSGAPLTSHDTGSAIVSVEQTLAEDLHLKLGDKLTFQIGERSLIATIVNFRTLDWSSFHPNFFMIFPPGVLDPFPTTYITSFHLAANQTLLLNQLIQLFPNVTIIDVASILAQIQDLLNKVTLAVQYLFLFALGAGILIFIVSLQASLDERRLTYRLLHTLGASRRYIRQSICVEFTCLFGLIALSATGVAYFIVYMLLYKVFNIS